MGAGSKMGIDATTKWAEEGYQREWPDEIEMSQEIKDTVSRRWEEYGIE
jgi:4-hydroxy-3-polyprenylbenzoate decarboxylase